MFSGAPKIVIYSTFHLDGQMPAEPLVGVQPGIRSAKIAHMSPYQSEQVSGINRVVQLLGVNLKPLGFQISLWCPANGDEAEGLVLIPVGFRRGRNLILAARTFTSLMRRDW